MKEEEEKVRGGKGETFSARIEKEAKI